jgi:DegV family protein with EDD domain
MIKRSVAVVTDSIADLPSEQVEALKISVVPAILIIEGQSYVDGEEISREEFYRRMPTMSEPATTAIPSSIAFEKEYRRLFDSGIERILSIHVASQLSGMINAASQAAQAFNGRVRIFDSKQLTMALGFQVMEAAEASLRGESLDSVLEVARSVRDRVRLVALIDTLEYLKRSGRISWLRASLGDLLQMKLLVNVIDGVVGRLGITRTHRKGVNKLLSHVKSWGSLERLAVLHSAIPDEASTFADKVRHLSENPPLVVDVTTLIGTHVGPKAIGLAGLCK